MKRKQQVPNAPADAPWRKIIARTREALRRSAKLAARANLPPGPAVTFADGRVPTREELAKLTCARYHEPDPDDGEDPTPRRARRRA